MCRGHHRWTVSLQSDRLQRSYSNRNRWVCTATNSNSLLPCKLPQHLRMFDALTTVFDCRQEKTDRWIIYLAIGRSPMIPLQLQPIIPLNASSSWSNLLQRSYILPQQVTIFDSISFDLFAKQFGQSPTIPFQFAAEYITIHDASPTQTSQHLCSISNIAIGALTQSRNTYARFGNARSRLQACKTGCWTIHVTVWTVVNDLIPTAADCIVESKFWLNS